MIKKQLKQKLKFKDQVELSYCMLCIRVRCLITDIFF